MLLAVPGSHRTPDPLLIGGKLYTMGGGWETLAVNALPARHHFAIAVSFLIPWQETNLRHDMRIDLVDEDGKQFARVGGELEVGRPAGIRLGQTQRLMIAVNLHQEFKALGTYLVRATVEEQEMRRITFRVVPGPQLALQRTTEPASPEST